MSRAKKFQKLADKLLTKFDERTDNKIAFSHKSSERTYNSTTGQYEYSYETYTCTGVTIDATSDLIDGQAVMVGDVIVKVDPFMKDSSGVTVSVQPQEGDELSVNGQVYNVTSSTVISYAGEQTPIMYQAVCRK